MSSDPNGHAAAVGLFMAVLDLSRVEALALADEGHTSIEEVAYAPLEELLRAPGMEQWRILEVRARAAKCMTPGNSA